MNVALINDSPKWELIIYDEISAISNVGITHIHSWSMEMIFEINNHCIDHIILNLNKSKTSNLINCELIKQQTPCVPFTVFVELVKSFNDVIEYYNIGAKGVINKRNLGCVKSQLTTILKHNSDSSFIYKKLTSTEIKIIELVCKKQSNYEIAEAICKSDKTVEKYLSEISKKIGVKNNKLSIFEFAIKHGLYNIYNNDY